MAAAIFMSWMKEVTMFFCYTKCSFRKNNKLHLHFSPILRYNKFTIIRKGVAKWKNC